MGKSVGGLRSYPNTIPATLVGLQGILQTIGNIRLNDQILWQALTNQAANVQANFNPSNATNGAGAATGTLTNAPTSGNPAFWMPIIINGTTYYIPAWS
jgi:hypothetical protein